MPIGRHRWPLCRPAEGTPLVRVLRRAPLRDPTVAGMRGVPGVIPEGGEVPNLPFVRACVPPSLHRSVARDVAWLPDLPCLRHWQGIVAGGLRPSWLIWISDLVSIPLPRVCVLAHFFLLFFIIASFAEIYSLL